MPYRTWLALIAAILLTIAATLAAALAFAIHLVRVPNYPEKMADPSLVAQESPFLLHGQACQIVVYGDSTASIGVDPRILTARTGLSACNIASTRPIVDDLGTLPLDAYLAHNAAPKFIVLQFGPELFFRGQNWEHNGPYAPMVMLARDFPTHTGILTMLTHPAETTQFLVFILRHDFFPDTKGQAEKQQRYQREVARLIDSHGMLPLDFPATQSCLTTPAALHGPLDTAWINTLRTRYQTPQTTVLIKASPIPDCDLQLAFFKQALAPYTDQNVAPLPIQSFLHDDRHPSPEGIKRGTEQLAQALQAHLRSQPN